MRTLLQLIPAAFIFFAAIPAYAQTACTMEAKLCPDGETYVGRQGPNCEFAPCPGVEMFDCDPHMCADGTEVARCAADGSQIMYFAAPCMTHGGEEGAPFEDVIADHPNADAIFYAKSQGIVEGYADDTFKPDATINRAEFMKILMRVNLLRIDEAMERDPNMIWEDGMCIAVFGDPDIGMGLSDVDESTWYAGAVCHGLSQRLIDGYPDGTFRPGNNINFAEAAKILMHVFKFAYEPSDVWYEGYVRGLAGQNAIPTSIVRFDQNITRGEMAEMIYRLKSGVEVSEYQTYEELR